MYVKNAYSITEFPPILTQDATTSTLAGIPLQGVSNTPLYTDTLSWIPLQGVSNASLYTDTLSLPIECRVFSDMIFDTRIKCYINTVYE